MFTLKEGTFTDGFHGIRNIYPAQVHAVGKGRITDFSNGFRDFNIGKSQTVFKLMVGDFCKRGRQPDGFKFTAAFEGVGSDLIYAIRDSKSFKPPKGGEGVIIYFSDK